MAPWLEVRAFTVSLAGTPWQKGDTSTVALREPALGFPSAHPLDCIAFLPVEYLCQTRSFLWCDASAACAPVCCLLTCEVCVCQVR